MLLDTSHICSLSTSLPNHVRIPRPETILSIQGSVANTVSAMRLKDDELQAVGMYAGHINRM
jgi:hypothetical protein